MVQEKRDVRQQLDVVTLMISRFLRELPEKRA